MSPLLIVALLLSLARAQPIARRGLLKSGVAGLLGGLFRPTVAATPSPVVVTEVSEILVRHRSAELGGIFPKFPWPESAYDRPYYSYLQTPEFEVLEDWRKAHPERGAALESIFERMRRVNAGEVSGEQWSLEQHAIGQDLERLDVEWPWSSRDWGTVFGERLARVELDLARAANVDVGQVYALTRQIISDLAHGQNMLLFEDLVANTFDERVMPLYSSAWIEAYASKCEAISPALAIAVRRADTPRFIDRSEIRQTLVNATKQLVYAPDDSYVTADFHPLPLKFWSGKLPHLRPRHTVLVLERETAQRARVFENLLLLERRLPLLAESNFKTVAIEELAHVKSELLTEIQTLPSRVKEFNAGLRRMEEGASSRLDGRTWDQLTAAARHSPLAERLAWAHTLEGLGATFRNVLPIALELVATAEATATCGELLAEAGAPPEPPLLTHDASAELSLGTEAPVPLPIEADPEP